MTRPWPWWRPASPRPCSPPPWVFWPPCRRAMAEINVTPSVDVMLALLIVFMVTAPLLTVGVPVDLPKTKAPALGQDREPLSVTVRRDGVIFLLKEQVPQEALVD